jgi:hypothetical protein
MAAKKKRVAKARVRPGPSSDSGSSRAVSLTAVAVAGLVLAALWVFDLTTLKTPVLTPFVGGGASLPATTPIYAFWVPAARVQGLVFVAVFTALVALTPLLCDPARTRRATFVAALFTSAILVPLALFGVREPIGRLGALLTIYRGEEIYEDALRIRVYAPFLRDYVALMPELSLHGRHFPPGHASWIYAVVALFGPSTFAIGVVVLFAFALGMPLAYGTFLPLAGERGARTAALLLLATPSLVDFACTSMDAVFVTAALACTFLAVRVAGALNTQSNALWPLAAATGVALFGATFLSFSAVPLGLMIALYVGISARTMLARGATVLAVIAGSFAASGLLLWAVSGFSMVECVSTAIRLNREFMSEVVGRDVRELYGYLAFGGIAGFLIGSGAGLVAAAGAGSWVRPARWSPWTIATWVALAVMCFGGISYMETERVWTYAMPWLAGVAVGGGAIEDRSLRWLLIAGGAQMLAMEICLFTLW